MPYHDFAALYDALTTDIPYEKWADYIELLFQKFGVEKPKLVLELACGTGTMTALLADRGYDMVALDRSAEMLGVAAGKTQGKGVLLLEQDMTDFELYGTVDAVLCLLDSVNYVTEDEDLARMLHWVANYLEPGGLFVFDVNTPYKFDHVLGDNTFVYDDGKIFYTWENYREGDLAYYDLTFFVEEEKGRYRRFEETHTERVYPPEKLQNALENAGLHTEAVLHELTLDAPKAETERVFFVARK